MVRLFLLIGIICLTNPLNGQSITASDNNTCIGTVANVANFSGSGGVPIRNTYNGNLQNNTPFRVIWDSSESRWELQIDNSNPPDGIFETQVFGNSYASAPNPPELGTGDWVDLLGFCGNLTVFEGSGTQNVLLPIELLSFRGESMGKVVELFWETASEINNQKFEIEYSSNGKGFKKIGYIEGQGNSNQRTEYNYSHQPTSLEIAYYRLKQIDFDGNFSYSQIVNVILESAKNEVRIYPNPSQSGEFNLEVLADNLGDIKIIIFDLTGRAITKKNESFTKGINIFNCNFPNIGKGMFILGLEFGNQIQYKKLKLE